MYIFQWLSSTEKRIGEIPVVRAILNISILRFLTRPVSVSLPQDQLKTQQTELEATLVKIILAPEPYPPPGRALRNVVARCLTLLYTRAESRSLFDTLQAFMKVTSDFKATDKDVYKMYALPSFFSVGFV
jgi:HEAT repeat-containing protein 5